MQAAFGEDGTVFLIVIVAVHLPVMMLVSVVLTNGRCAPTGCESGGVSRRDAMRRLGVALATHPILLGIVAGLAVAARRPANSRRPLAIIIEPLGRTGGPLALFASGMALVNFGMARQIGPAIAISGAEAGGDAGAGFRRGARHRAAADRRRGRDADGRVPDGRQRIPDGEPARHRPGARLQHPAHLHRRRACSTRDAVAVVLQATLG